MQVTGIQNSKVESSRLSRVASTPEATLCLSLRQPTVGPLLARQLRCSAGGAILEAVQRASWACECPSSSWGLRECCGDSTRTRGAFLSFCSTPYQDRGPIYAPSCSITAEIRLLQPASEATFKSTSCLREKGPNRRRGRSALSVPRELAR